MLSGPFTLKNALHDLEHAVGGDRTRIDGNDANPVIEARAAERLGKGHQRRIERADGIDPGALIRPPSTPSIA
jgi:hypothetical protein